MKTETYLVNMLLDDENENERQAIIIASCRKADFLVIEDTEEEIVKAKSIFKNACFVSNLEDAQFVIKSLANTTMGIVTDLYIPSEFTKTPEPFGLEVAIMAKNLDYKTVVCTDLHHHGGGQWLWNLCQILQIPLIDTKDWAKSYAVINAKNEDEMLALLSSQ